LERRIFGERWSASERSRCRHGCATSLHDDEDFKLGGKTVSEVRSLTSCHEKKHKNEGEIIREKKSSGSEDIILKETRGNKVLKCMYANVRSIVSVQKGAELELYVNNEASDIIGITESWTKQEIADSELALGGYRLFRRDWGTRNQRDMGQEGCCYMSRAVLMQWRDGICVMRLSRRTSCVKFSLKSLRCFWKLLQGAGCHRRVLSRNVQITGKGE